MGFYPFGNGSQTWGQQETSNGAGSSYWTDPVPPVGDSYQQIIVPLYVYPTYFDSTGDYQTMQAGAPTARVVILNPNSGPGTFTTDWVNQIIELHASGMLAIGYVHSSFGARATSLVEADIATWYQYYGKITYEGRTLPGLDGIFIDEVDFHAATQPYYLNLYNYCKGFAAPALVVLNPGDIPDESYMQAGDIVCVLENTYSYFTTTYAGTRPTWMANYPAHRFMGIVHTMTNTSQVATALALAEELRLGYVYCLDSAGIYTALAGDATSNPSFWTAQVDWCRTGGVSAPAPTATLSPSGDTSGNADTDAINTALAAGNPVTLTEGVFYVNAPIQVPAGLIFKGTKGPAPSIYDEITAPLSGTILRATSTWSAGAVSSPAFVQITGLGVHLRDFWIDGTANVVASIDGVNDAGGSGFHSVNLRNVGVCNVTGIGVHQYGTEWVVFQCVANVCSSNGFSGSWVDSQLIDCFAQTCGYSGTGVGYYITGGQSKFIGCRGDVSQYGFFIDAGSASTYADMIQLIGCSTQRNNKMGIQIQNDSGSTGRVPVVLSGCVFDGDGVNGTIVQTSGAGPSGGTGGGGYASIALAGAVTVLIDGVSTTASTRDTGSTACPEYGITTSAVGGHGPNLVSVDGTFLNANVAAVNDAAPSNMFTVGPNVFSYTGAVYTGTPSTLPVQVAPIVPETLSLAPSGATAEAFPRQYAFTYFASLTSEQVYMSAIYLPKNLAVNDITLIVGGAAFTLADVTHGWYALCDSGRVVRAVSADQTSGNWASTFTEVTLAVLGAGSATYTTTYAGLYYIALCITFTGGSGEFSGLTAAVGGATGFAPILQGTSSSGQTTPPAIASTLGAISSVAGDRFYAYTS